MISIIVCTYNRDKYLGETLNRLAANAYEGEWEIVLINNNSTDTTHALCRAFEENHRAIPFRYFIEKQQGLSFARNRGMEEAGKQDGRTPLPTDWLVFLDDDAFVRPDYLQCLADYIQQLPNMAAFGGRIHPFFEDGQAPDWLCRWNRSWLSAIDKGDRVTVFRGNEFPIGANMGFSRAVANACGLFDTTLGRTGKNLIGGEEKDYFNRIKSQLSMLARKATSVAAQAYNRESASEQRTINYQLSTINYLPAIPVDHCIPPSRTTYDYIRRLGAGVGISEKARTLSKGKLTYANRLFSEGIKWCATIVLFLGYTLLGQSPKGRSLLIFRKEVTRTLV